MDKMSQFEQSLLSAKNDIGLIKGDISAMKSKQPISAPTSSDALYCNVVALPPLSKGSSCERLSSNCSGNISDGGNSSSSHSAIANNKQKSCQSTNSTSDDSSSDKETDGFQTVRNHRQRRHKKPVVGTKKYDQFHGNCPTVDMFIYRIPTNYTIDQVRDIAQDGVQVLKLSKVSHDDAVNNSYKLTIYVNDEEKVMQSSYWPEFVACRRFIPPRLRNNIN